MTIEIHQLTNVVEWAIKRQQGELDKFRERLADDPAYAFEWGQSALVAAARLREYSHLLQLMNSEQWTLPGLIDHYQRQLVRMAESSPSSTSRMSNEVENERRVAISKIVQTLTGEVMANL